MEKLNVKLIYEKQSPDTISNKGLKQIAKYRKAKAQDCSDYLDIFDHRNIAKNLFWYQKIY